jgi:hypothetical protein
VARGVTKKQSASQSKIGKSGNSERTELGFIHLFQLLLFICSYVFNLHYHVRAVKVEFVVFVFCAMLLCCQASL